MMKRSMVLASVLVSGVAWAQTSPQWTAEPVGSGNLFFTGVSMPSDGAIFAVGTIIEMPSGFGLPRLLPRVYASANGGATFIDASGTLGDAGEFSTAIQFLDLSIGWTAVGTHIYATQDTGFHWESVDLGKTVNDLHFFDTNNGFAVGDEGHIWRTDDGGATWEPPKTPVSEKLVSMFWLDDQRGWISGYQAHDDEEEVFASDGVVLRTQNGGADWEVVERFGEGALGVMFFLDDAKTGWLAGYEHWTAHQTEAKLYKTTDGGDTFVQMAVPLKVGTFDAGFFQNPINLASIVAMYWEDERTGHFAGSAFVAETTEAGGNSSATRSAHKTVDYVTYDGGDSWIKTDLGTITSDLTSLVEGDGFIYSGTFRNLFDGVLAGEKVLWSYSYPCPVNACPGGYVCGAAGCELDASVPGGDGGNGAAGDGSGADGGNGGSDNGGAAGNGTGLDGGISPTSGGCSTYAWLPPLWIWAGLPVVAMIRRRRNTRRRSANAL